MKIPKNFPGKMALLAASIVAISCSSGDILQKFDCLEAQEYLIDNFDANGDHKLSSQEAALITEIDLSSEKSKSLTGIDCLKNLEKLTCRYCESAVADLSDNPCLRDFYCEFSESLQSLQLPQSIQSVYVCKGEMTELVLGQTPFLTSLHCYSNKLQKIETGVCPYLTIINMENNLISEIDLSKYPNLREIYCDNNLLKTLDVSKNPRIETIRCKGNENIEIICKKGQKIEGVTYNPDYEYSIDNDVKITYID